MDLPSESQPLSQQDRVGELEDELIAALAKQLSARIDRATIEPQPGEDWVATANSAIRQDIHASETMMGASNADRQKTKAPLTAGKEELFSGVAPTENSR